MILLLLTLVAGPPPAVVAVAAVASRSTVAFGSDVASGFSRTIAHDAIVAAVQQRMGAGVEVVLERLVVSGEITAASARAVPGPDARLGAVIRFTLHSSDGATTFGAATARVTAIVPHLHAAQPLTRGAGLAPGDLTPVAHVVASGPLREWPGAESAVGGRLLRALAAGACVTRNLIQPVLAVRTGQQVTAVVSFDGVEARAVMVAAGGGDAGDVIRVVNRQSRRGLKARVVSAGIVEIIK
ncbi:MAG: flagellar basal body P-ring formation chaperone FlgA [Vicinamibacterales bacterium]